MTETTAVATWDPFVAMDQLDDQAIVDELEGRIVKALVYEFRQDGTTVRGLSKPGVDAVAREMAKQGEVLRELALDWTDDPSDSSAALFKCQVGRYTVQTDKATGEIREALLDTAYGVKRQSRYHPGGKPNPFWFETGSMKAARNARLRLIREDLKQAVIEMAVQEGRAQAVQAPRNAPTASRSPAQPSSPPARPPEPPQNEEGVASGSSDPASDQQRAYIERLLSDVGMEYADLLEIEELRTLPAWPDLTVASVPLAVNWLLAKKKANA